MVFLALSGIARGQNLVEAGFGVRGGLLANPSFQANRLPAVNVLLYDRVEVRFEAVHRRFGYQVQTVVGPGIQHIAKNSSKAVYTSV